MKRLFVAIKIHPEYKLLNAFDKIKRKCYAGNIKWVDKDLFHLTLKFIGETSEQNIPVISDVIKKTVYKTPGFEFLLQGLGVFGSSYRPRIIRVNIEEKEKLINIGNRLLDEFEDVGFKRDRQNFVPHITLGRIKQVRDKAMLQKVIRQFDSVPLQKVMVNELILYESLLSPKGPEYKVVERYLLSNG